MNAIINSDEYKALKAKTARLTAALAAAVAERDECMAERLTIYGQLKVERDAARADAERLMRALREMTSERNRLHADLVEVRLALINAEACRAQAEKLAGDMTSARDAVTK